MNIKKIATALGTGVVGGIAGTVAITAAMIFETRVSGPDQSASLHEVPAQAVEKTTGIEIENEEVASPFIHWAYGSGWGAFRGVLGLCGLRGPKATAVHFAAITTVASVVLPLLKLAPPPQKTPPRQLVAQSLNHLLYAIFAGLVYDALNSKK